MPTPQPTQQSAATATPALEILWQQDVSAYAFTRDPGGELSAAPLEAGIPAVVDVGRLVHGVAARRIGLRELIELAQEPPANIDLGGSARATFAILDRARRSVAEGLVHPQLELGPRAWLAFWGATLDETIQEALSGIAAALPRAAAEAFDGDREATVHDLYVCAVDVIARDALREAGVRLGGELARGRPTALSLFLAGLTEREPELMPHSGYAALERRLGAWVDGGLARRSPAPWLVSLRLDERPRPAAEGESTEAPPAIVLEIWLQAADDPTLSLPASLLREAGDAVFSFLRSSDPRRSLVRQLEAIEPLLAEGGIVFDADAATEVELEPDAVRFFLREAMPQLSEQGVPVLLPSDWVATRSRLRVNVTASSAAPVGARSSGLLSPAQLASFDWKLAIGDIVLTEEELEELAAAKEPLIRLQGRWHALRRSEVERAIRFLERRRTGGGVVDLVRAVSGVETEEAGLELGEVELDGILTGLLQGGERQFRPLPTPRGMQLALFPFQERGHGWLRMLGDLGIGAILADDMGLGKTVQAIAMLVSEREEAGGELLGPTLVVCPMSVARQWVREVDRFAPSLQVHLHHGLERLTGEELAEVARTSDVVVTSYDIAARDVDALALISWDRLLLDEAQDVKNAATKRARALRRLPARRKLAMTGTPIENRLGELWALMDIVNPGLLGSRERFERAFARPIEADGDEAALARLRSMVQPFILRRPKDAPEVELELPAITVRKEYCRLSLEQATLYRATVDRWMPRIAEHDEGFGRRGAVLAMLGQLKQVCNHPEMVLATGQSLEGRSGKLERLVELLQEVPRGEKALVFTQYPGFDRLVDHLEERLGRHVGFFHGGLGARRREEIVHAFSHDDDPSVLVISIRAGGRGLNLPAANHVFHFDRWWNPAVEQQATDRVHRFGQRKHVHVHSLICTATLEERIDQLLESKRELAEKVIAGHAESWLADLDLDAIRAAVALSPEAVEEAA